MNSLLSAAERKLDERKSQLPRAQREALKADLERITALVRRRLRPRRRRGASRVFAAGLDNFWSTLSLSEPVEDDVKIAGELYLAPLARLVGRGDGLLVAAVGRERGEVFRLSGGRLIEIADESEDVPGRHDQGGWSQARYERHIDEIVERHWRRVADTLDACLRKLPGAHVVLVGAEDMRSDFEDVLSNEVEGRLIGWTTAEAHADAAAAARGRAAGGRRVAGGEGDGAARALARGGGKERPRGGGLGADARGRIGRPRRAAARPGRRRPSRPISARRADARR